MDHNLIMNSYSQVSLSIFWTLIALFLIFVSSKLNKRILWITGASLMCIVIIKLFVLDLQELSKIASTISFISVGLLLLIVGYTSPIPKKIEKTIEG